VFPGTPAVGEELLQFPNLKVLYLHSNMLSASCGWEKLARLPSLANLTLHDNPRRDQQAPPSGTPPSLQDTPYTELVILQGGGAVCALVAAAAPLDHVPNLQFRILTTLGPGLKKLNFSPVWERSPFSIRGQRRYSGDPGLKASIEGV
jgi:hypothetical protein